MKFKFGINVILAIVALLFSATIVAQQKTEHVVVITLDGFRWQELFHGADSFIINNNKYTDDIKGMNEKYWSATTTERRKKLLPFFWNTVATQGQLYGNRGFGNYVNNANPYWFSYPGYNEIFTGFPDTAVNSNNKKWNKNENVLEFINKQKGFEGKVAAFTSWDVFPYILNEERSKIYVNSAFEKTKFKSPTFELLDDMQDHAPRILGDGVRLDLLTFYIAKEYLKTYKPRVLYIGFDETDDFAHAGKYDLYLQSAYMVDQLIADMWGWLQVDPYYKNKTTLIVTTDHGRGDADKDQWKDHGAKVPDASEIWLAVMGPDTEASGEVKTPMQLYQRQVATTIASILGFTFQPKQQVMEPVETIMRKR
ncbi:alkaline phosphatase family protein [Lacibacter sp. H375]|uniref:alkaline phosphatase family protein n=1 Tax=Lacibacter sp. H375 TaxID=3133424 RepID=UPI0030BAD97E